MPTTDYQKTLDWLYALEAAKGMDFKLDRVARALERLGNPHRQYPSIHIAGTNGKGSVAAMLHAVLDAGGYRVGLYTSPHLVRFTERILVGVDEIGEGDVVQLANEVRQSVAGIDLTFFEIGTVMAFLFFARAKVDVAVIETGLGGRLDATNVIDPIVSVITTIGLDHTEFLGETIESIAAEKGGIIKCGRPVVIGRLPVAAETVIRRIADERNASVSALGRNFTAKVGAEGIAFEGQRLSLANLHLGLSAGYQVDNMASALATLDLLPEELRVTDETVREGLAKVRWPGRFERIEGDPLVILDGAHNVEGMRTLVRELEATVSGRPIHALFAVMRDKPWPEMVELLAPLCRGAVITEVLPLRGAMAADVAGVWSKYSPATAIRDPAAAWAQIRSCAKPGDLILVTGSLFLIGAVYALCRGGWDVGIGREAESGAPLKRARRPFAVVLTLGCVLLPLPVLGQLKVELEPEEEVEINADSMMYDRAADQIGASGNVVIRRGDSRLSADQVRFDRKSNTADAFGSVEFSSIEGWLHAEQANIDLDDETGGLLKAEVASERLGYSLRGDRIEKDVGQRYEIENGKFTTCRCAKGPPSWSITGKKLDVTLDGYGRVEEARFCIMDVPVLYLPKLAIPVHSERQSGFLFPEVGFSNQRGLRILQPFYWAISKSQDLTITPGIETSARVGLTGEYRYSFRRDMHGDIELAYYNEAIRGVASGTTNDNNMTATIPENRWAVFGEHLQKVYGSDVYADLQVVGDDQFLREITTHGIDYGSQLAYRTRPFTTSRAGFLTKWDHFALQGEALVYQDLVDKQAFALQRLPELRLIGQRFLGWKTHADIVSSLTNFQREESVDGVRVDLQPGLGARVPLGRSFFGGISARFHETAYQLTDNVMAQTCSESEPCPLDAVCDQGRCRNVETGDLTDEMRLPHTQSRESVELRADLRTELSRVFEFNHFGIQKLKHTIEPQVEYLYVPDVHQEDLPVFDSLDRINRRNLLSYGIASRLLARSVADPNRRNSSSVYELARFSVLQSYDFEREIVPFGGAGEESHFSDVDIALRINPSRITSIRAAANYDVLNGQVPAALVGVQLFEPLPVHDDTPGRQTIRNSLSVSYRFISQDVLQLLQGSMVVRVTDHIGGIYATRYDIQENRFLENFVGMRYISTCDCWSIDIGVSDTANPNEVQLRAQVSLLGFGSGTSLGGKRIGDERPDL